MTRGRWMGVLAVVGLATAGTAAAGTTAQARPPGTDMVTPRAAQQNSANWAGYVVRQSDLHKITSHYRVPAVDCSHLPDPERPYTNASIWIGLDGGLPAGNTSIEQVGVDANCSDADDPEYQAWWEMEGPNADTGDHKLSKNDYAVLPGDFIRSAVTWDSGNTFTLTLANYRQATPATGAAVWTFSQKESLPGGAEPLLNSAEAVVERPVDSNIGRYLSLSNFGSVDFSRVQLNKKPLRDFDDDATALTLLQDTGASPPPDNVLAVPSALSAEASDAFTVTWKNYGTPRTP